MRALNPARALTSLVPAPGPRRIYALSVLIGTFGFGLIMTTMTLYATRVLHLSTAKTGLGLTIAGLIGLLAGLPLGDLADRRGPREMVQLAMLGQCAAALCFLFIRDFAGLVGTATLDMLSVSAVQAADGPLIRRVGGDGAAEFRAGTQAIANLGISFGLLGSAIAVQIDSPDAYRALFGINALAIASGVLVLRRLPHYPPLPRPEHGARWGALRDRPFVAFTLLSGLMYMQYSVITLMLPLWIVYHTHAPRWCIALLVLVNTIIVTFFQVRIGSGVKTVVQGGTALLRSGVIFLLSCSAMGLAAGLPTWAALSLLIAAVAVHTYGEIWYASAAFALEFGLAPAHAQGQYQGLIGAGTGLGQAAAPLVLVGVCLGLGRVGFIALGACFALLGLAAPALARWGERTRPASPEPTSSLTGVTTDNIVN
jgi:MFS family permease